MGIPAIVIGLVLGPVPPVGGFDLGPHEAILKDALADGNTLSAEALRWVTGSFLGGGNLGVDKHQASPEKHFDSAKSPREICDQWKRGLNAALERAVDLAGPALNDTVEKRRLKDRRGALEAFGEATHAIADFYAHTTWIELHQLQHYNLPLAIPQAPILGQRCDRAAFPPRLQSGYFTVFSPPDFCPSGGPPKGFAYCHKDIAKDKPDRGTHGGEVAGAGGVTYFQIAKALSVTATRMAWEALHDRIVARYLTDATDAECLFMKLAWGEDRSCHRLWQAEGRIKTRQEYAIPDGRLIHELDLTVEIELRSASVEYPGPKKAPVYADVRGTTRQRGTFCETAITKRGTVRRCQPYRSDTIGSDDARLKVTPYADPIELDWRVTFPGKKPACKANVIFRLDPNAPPTQPFPNCPGPMPGMESRVISLKYSGTFKLFPDSP